MKKRRDHARKKEEKQKARQEEKLIANWNIDNQMVAGGENKEIDIKWVNKTDVCKSRAYYYIFLSCHMNLFGVILKSFTEVWYGLFTLSMQVFVLF